MDNDASSSIYTTDSPKPSATPNRRPSMDNDIRPTSSFGLQTPPSPAGSHRRRISYTPSYMSFQNGTSPASKPVPIARKPSQPPQLPSKPQRLLLIAIAGLPGPTIISSLRALAKKDSFSDIVIMGSAAYTTQVKKLKMNVLSLVGKLGKETGVQMHLKENWTDLKDVLGDVQQIGGVMCYPSYETEQITTTDMLSLEQSELENSWRDSVGFLHSIAKSTFPLLQKQESETPPMFLLMDTPAESPASSLNKDTCEALFKRLNKANSSRLVIEVLVPEKDTVEPKPTLSLEPAVEFEADSSDTFKAGESPTSLWNMWSLQEHIETAE